VSHLLLVGAVRLLSGVGQRRWVERRRSRVARRRRRGRDE
jgi:hypothetical protein